MQQRRAVANCFFRIDHDRERLEVDLDQFERILGQIAAFRHDADDRLADVAHLVARQREDRRRVVVRHARGREQRAYLG